MSAMAQLLVILREHAVRPKDLARVHRGQTLRCAQGDNDGPARR